MAKIDLVNARLETYTQEAEAIKSKIQEVAQNKDITIEGGVDTPLSVLGKIDGLNEFHKVHITQVINGDTCGLEIEKYTSQATNNYMMGVVVENNKTKLYIIDL